MDIQYWEEYYRKHPYAFDPSDFAKYVIKYINANEHVIDLGCGNGRDTIFFKTVGALATGIDQCENQINILKKTYENDYVKFKSGNFIDLRNDLHVDHAYSRFTLHSIDEKSENTLITWASKCVNKYFFIETRSDKDSLNGVKTDHYRRFINMNALLSKLIAHGFEIEYAEISRNYSKYKSIYNVDYNEENPMLIRVVARKPVL